MSIAVLGIDPGTFKSAYCAWDGKEVLGKGIVTNAELLLIIKLYSSSPDMVVACEHLQCFGMPIGVSTLETAYWIGHFRAWCVLNKLLFLPVYRSEVKMFYCHNMRAKDANIRAALIDKLGAPGTKKEQGVTYGVSGDVWSALAIAAMVHEKSPVYEQSFV
jgi:hypothetical protein